MYGEWVNCGEVDFLTYGGNQIRKNNDGTISVFHLETPEISSDIPYGKVFAALATIDPDHDWYDWNEIYSEYGLPNDATLKEQMNALIDYYGILSDYIQAESLYSFSPAYYDDYLAPISEVQVWMEALEIMYF